MAVVIDRFQTVLVGRATDGKRETPIQIEPHRAVLDLVPFSKGGEDEGSLVGDLRPRLVESGDGGMSRQTLILARAGGPVDRVVADFRAVIADAAVALRLILDAERDAHGR